jgi:hypothetical protein
MANKKIVENTRQVGRNTKPQLTVDWTTSAGLKPFYDFERKGYSVSVQLGYESVGPNSRFKKTAYPNEYVTAGVNKIVEYYNKKPVEKPLDVGQAITYYVPERPRAKVKVLVTIPEDVFLSLPENDNIVVSSTKEINLDTLNLDKKIDGIYKILLEYYEEEKKFSGKVYGFDFENEANDLINFFPALTTLASENGYDLSTAASSLYKIGVGDNYDIKYVQTYEDQEYKNLTVNLGKFKDNSAIKNKQTVFIIDKMNDIYGSYKAVPQMDWEAFLDKFVVPGKPYRIEHGENRTYSPLESPIVRSTKESLNAQAVRTKDELDRDKKNLQNPLIQQQFIESRKKAVDNVEQGILNNLKSVENSLTSVESTYEQFLHKYQITPLVRQAIICLDPNGEIARRYAQIKQAIREANRFVEGVIEILKIPVIELPSFGVTVDIMKDIFKSILKAIGEALFQALIQLLRDIVRMIVESCGNPDKMNFGGYNIKEIFTNPAVATDFLVNDLLVGRIGGATLNGIEAGVLNVEQLELTASKKIVNNIRGFLSNEQVQGMINAGAFDPDGDFSRFWDEVSNFFTPGEIAKYLRGTPPQETIQALQTTIATSDRYSSEFRNFLSTKGAIEDIGRSLGDLVDQNEFFEEIEKAQETSWHPWNGLCGDDADTRAKLLETKGMSKDEIDKQLSDADELRRKRIDQLNDILQKDNLLDGVVPPPYCTVDKDGNVVPGLTELDHPSFTFTLNRTLNTVFDGIYVQFNREMDGFVPSLKQNVADGFEEIPRVILKENFQDLEELNDDRDSDTEPLSSLFMINPKFEIYKGQGYQTNEPFPSQYRLLPEVSDLVVKGDIAGGDRTNTTKDDRVSIDVENVKKFATGINPDGEAAFIHYSSNPSGYRNFERRGAKRARDFNILVPKQSNKVAPGLQENLENLSLTSSVDTNLTFSDSKIQLRIPNLTLQSIENSLNPAAGSSGVNIQSALQTIANATDSQGLNIGPEKWQVLYEPTKSSASTFSSDESFVLKIASYSGRNEFIIQSTGIDRPINPSALFVINTLDLTDDYSNIAPEESPQENIFNSLMNNVFVNGALSASKGESSAPQRMETITSTNYSAYPYMRLPDGAGSSLNILSELKEDQTPVLENLYKELLRDFMTAFSGEISKSDFFKNEVLELVNFAPYLSAAKLKQAKDNGEECLDPHLLNIDGVKRAVKQNYDQAKCIQSVQPSVDGIGTNRENALESSIIKGAVVLTFRLYVMEFLLKSMWAFSEFNFDNEDDVDYTLVTSVRNKIVTEISKRTTTDITYISDFTNEVVKMYQRMRMLNPNPGTNMPPLQIDPTVPLVEGAGIETKLSVPATFAYDYLLKIEINNMMKKLNVILGDPETDKRISSAIVDSMIPLVDVQSNTNDNVYNKGAKFLNQVNEYEDQLLERGLDRATITTKARRYLDEDNFLTTYEEIIRSLTKPAVRDNLSTQVLHFPIYKNIRQDNSNPEDINSWKENSYTPIQNASSAPAVASAQLTSRPVGVFSKLGGLLSFLNPTPAKDNDGNLLPGTYAPLSLIESGKYSSWNSMMKPSNLSEQSWSESGIKSSDIWSDRISHNELSGTIKLIDLLNNPNALPPGNAGQTYSIPVVTDPRNTASKYEYYSFEFNSGDFADIPLYRKLELPYADKTLDVNDRTGYPNLPGGWSESRHYLDGQRNILLGGIFWYLAGYDGARPSLANFVDNGVPPTLEWVKNSSGQFSFTRNSAGVRPVSLAGAANVTFPNNSVGGSRLAEFQWDYTFKSWNLIDSRVQTLPGNISKEISHYSRMSSIINSRPDSSISPDQSNDRQLYKLMSRQFYQNRALWKLNRTEMIRLDKVVDEFRTRGTWHGRKIPSSLELQRLVEQLHFFEFGGKGVIRVSDDVKNRQRLGSNYPTVDAERINVINQQAAWDSNSSFTPQAIADDPSAVKCPFSFVYILDQIATRLKRVEDGFTNPGYVFQTFLHRSNQNVLDGYDNTFTSGRALIDLPNDVDFGWPKTPPSYPGDSQWMPRLAYRGDRIKARQTIKLEPTQTSNGKYGNVDLDVLQTTCPNQPSKNPNGLNMDEYFTFWEIDWWMSKLTSFMLLNDSFKEYRYIKDYLEHLRDIRSAAEDVRDSFEQDVRDRRKARAEIEAQLGGLLKTRQAKGNPLTSIFGNGNVVLEKYVKIKDKDWDQLIADATAAGDQNLARNYNSLKSIIADRDWTLQGIVKMEHFQQWHKD